MGDAHQQLVGDLFNGMATGLGTNTFSFVNNNDQVEAIFQVPDDKGAASLVITRLGYCLSSVTGTSPVMKISLQGVDASGNPDGTIKGGGSPASATFTPAGSNTFNWVNLANSYTAARGEWLAWVIAYNGGTINASNRPIIANSLNGALIYHPYAIGNVAGTRTRVQSPIWGFGSAGRAFGMPVQTISSTAFSTNNERALRFMLDPAIATTFKVIGVRASLSTPAAGKTIKLFLYSGTTVLQTATWDSDFVVATGAAGRPVCLFFQDATLATLSAGVEYRLAFAPQDAAANMAVQQFDVNAAADLEAFSGGQQWYLSTRAGGAWTDVLTSRPWICPILSDVTPGIGARRAWGTR